MLYYQPDRLLRVGQAVFMAAGAPEDIAKRVAEALVDANLAGHDSHGVIRIPEYVNAIAAGELIPSSRPDVVLDFATSAVAAGKVVLAHAKEEKLPPGCIIDSRGEPSTNPADYLDGGFLLPFGGHKGYGLAVVAELLGQAVTGSDVMAMESGGGPTYGTGGALLLALDPALFRPREEYVRTADAALGRIKAVPPAPGFSEVRLPGERLLKARAKTTSEGIPVAETTWEEIRACASRLGLQVDSVA